MTENECINKIQWRIDIASAISGDGKDGKAFEDLEMAIQALEKQSMANEILNELREYSSIGTIEEFKDLKENQFFNFDSPVVRIDKKSYDKAIDDFAEKIFYYCSMSNMNATMIRQIAEQLKGEKQ